MRWVENLSDWCGIWLLFQRRTQGWPCPFEHMPCVPLSSLHAWWALSSLPGGKGDTHGKEWASSHAPQWRLEGAGSKISHPPGGYAFVILECVTLLWKGFPWGQMLLKTESSECFKNMIIFLFLWPEAQEKISPSSQWKPGDAPGGKTNERVRTPLWLDLPVFSNCQDLPHWVSSNWPMTV